MFKKVSMVLFISCFLFIGGVAFSSDSATLTVTSSVPSGVSVRFTNGSSVQTVDVVLVEGTTLTTDVVSTNKKVEVLANSSWSISITGDKLENTQDSTKYISFSPRIGTANSTEVSGNGTSGWEGAYEIFMRDFLYFDNGAHINGTAAASIPAGQYTGDITITISAS